MVHKKQVLKLLCLFLASLIIRVLFYNAFLRDNPVQLAFDAGHYHTVAANVAAGKGLVNDDGTPHFYRLPGYPLSLAGCYKIFGVDASRALWVQLLLASLVPVLVFLLALQMFTSNTIVAMFAAMVTALHPGFLIFSGLVMSETLFMLFFLGFLLLFFGVLYNQCAIKKALAAGIFLGVASLIRPIEPVIVLLAIALLVCLMPSRKQALCASATLFTGWCAVVGVWLLRNFLLTGSLFLHTLSGPHLLNHGAVRVVMRAQKISYEQAKRDVDVWLKQAEQQARMLTGGQLHEIDASRCAQRLAVTVFIAHPVQTFKLCLVNALKTVFSLYSSELLFIDSGGQLPPYQPNRGIKEMVLRFLNPDVHNRWIIWIIYAEIMLNIMLLFGFCGFIIDALIRHKDLSVVVMAASFFLLFIALSSICGFARLRLPIEPFFIMLSLMFWRRVCKKRVV